MQLIERDAWMVRLVIKQRLEELGLEQRNLAAAPKSRSPTFAAADGEKITPRAQPNRRLREDGKFLKLPGGKLAKLADHQRKEVLKRNLVTRPSPV